MLLVCRERESERERERDRERERERVRERRKKGNYFLFTTMEPPQKGISLLT